MSSSSDEIQRVENAVATIERMVSYLEVIKDSARTFYVPAVQGVIDAIKDQIVEPHKRVKHLQAELQQSLSLAQTEQAGLASRLEDLNTREASVLQREKNATEQLSEASSAKGFAESASKTLAERYVSFTCYSK